MRRETQTIFVFVPPPGEIVFSEWRLTAFTLASLEGPDVCIKKPITFLGYCKAKGGEEKNRRFFEDTDIKSKLPKLSSATQKNKKPTGVLLLAEAVAGAGSAAGAGTVAQAGRRCLKIRI